MLIVKLDSLLLAIVNESVEAANLYALVNSTICRRHSLRSVLEVFELNIYHYYEIGTQLSCI